MYSFFNFCHLVHKKKEMGDECLKKVPWDTKIDLLFTCLIFPILQYYYEINNILLETI